MNNVDDAAIATLEVVGLAVLSFYGLGLGLLVAIIAAFVAIHFMRRKTYEKSYLIFSLTMGGAVVGLLLMLPISIELMLCTHLSRTCSNYLRPVLELSFRAITATPSLGAIIGVFVGYRKLVTKYR